MTFRRTNTSFNTVSCSSLFMLYDLSDEMMLIMWYARENAYWDVGDVEICGCFRFGMFQIWNVQDVGC